MASAAARGCSGCGSLARQRVPATIPFRVQPGVASTPNSDPQVRRIGPDDRPFTVAEVRGHVADLIREFEGKPGVELLGVVAAMLAQTRCVCAPATSHEATVVALPLTSRHSTE